ncbi:MAG TPA: adenylate/guanylate cyclase domain-containing protein [Stellaceae bacterium]|nr:adenylate/guanylate cyclase domain-containing protein [Stellaceae bacterium]
MEFRSVVDAVRCAIETRTGLVERNAALPPERRIEFRIGIHLGDVMEEADGDLMGDGVNIAARLETLCGAGRRLPVRGRLSPGPQPSRPRRRRSRRPGLEEHRRADAGLRAHRRQAGDGQNGANLSR